MFGPMPYLNQTMTSGPSATFGIMLKLTSTGISSFSTVRNQQNITASATAALTPRT